MIENCYSNVLTISCTRILDGGVHIIWFVFGLIVFNSEIHWQIRNGIVTAIGINTFGDVAIVGPHSWPPKVVSPFVGKVLWRIDTFNENLFGISRHVDHPSILNT